MTSRKYPKSSIGGVSVIKMNKYGHHRVMFVGEVVIVLVCWEGCPLLGWLQMSFGVMKDDTLASHSLHVYALIHQVLDAVHHLAVEQQLGEDRAVLLQVVNGQHTSIGT